MSPRTQRDKQKSEARSQRYALLLIWGLICVVGLGLLLYGQSRIKQARASLDWPVVTGEIVTSRVTSHSDENGTTYSADIDYVYSVNGSEYRSSVVVIGGHEYRPHEAVARYPLGKKVPVSYDPQTFSRAVLEPGVESYLFQKWGLGIILASLFMASLFNFILRRAAHEERNLLDKAMILTFKTIFFPIIICKERLWLLGIMIGVTGYLAILEIHPVITIACAAFAAFYGVIGVLWLWCVFMGWLGSLVDKP